MVNIKIVGCENITATDVINGLGKVPVIGTGVGVCHITYGVAKAAFCGIAASYAVINTGNSQGLNDHAIDGLLYVGRGVVELTPIFGGIILCCYDYKKPKKTEESTLLA